MQSMWWFDQNTDLRRGLTMSLSSVLWIGASWGGVDLNNMESNTEEQENKLKAMKETKLT